MAKLMICSKCLLLVVRIGGRWVTAEGQHATCAHDGRRHTPVAR